MIIEDTGSRSVLVKSVKKERRRILPSNFSKIILSSVLAFFVVASQSLLFAGFEAHIVNVTARICNYSETRTMGYWKNHPNVYLPLLPQYLGAPAGDETIDTQQKVNQVYLDYNLSMRNKLRGQLLAMKFNIANFGIGEYFVEDEGKTLNEIVADADNLLRDLNMPDSVLEEMKDLLDTLNNLHQIRFCASQPAGLEPPAIVDVVINEFLPNPAGNDNALKPDGEWVELYNKGNEIDVAGWVLYDANNSHELEITGGNTNTGNTVIAPGGFLVVYRNGDGDFTLNNEGGDTVRLYKGSIDSGADLIDSHSYSVDAPEGKTFARIPDGSDNWVDPIPTPGKPNILGNEETIFGPAIAEPDEETYIETQNEAAYFEIVGEPAEQEEPATEEPIIEEPVIEEPAVEQPVAEEPNAEPPLILEDSGSGTPPVVDSGESL